MTTRFEAEGPLRVLECTNEDPPGWTNGIVVASGYEITNRKIIIGLLERGDKGRVLVTDTDSGTSVQIIAKDRTPTGKPATLENARDVFKYAEVRTIRK